MAYSKQQKADALLKLAFNNHDFKKTASETGISEKQIRRWAQGQNIRNVSKSPEKDDDIVPDVSVAEILEQAVKKLLGSVPKDMSGSQWATAIGILMDKWLILQDQPTQRIDVIARMLERLPADEYDDILREAEEVLREARSGDSSE